MVVNTTLTISGTTITLAKADGSAITASGAVGSITGLKWSNEAGIDAMPLPGGGSTGTWLTDFNGVERRLTVEGVWTGTSTQIKAQIKDVNDLQDGLQSSGAFVSTFIDGATINVMIDKLSIDWDIVGGMAKWSLSLVQGEG